MTSLSILDSIPDGLLQCDSRELHRIISGPSLIELPGADRAPLFVSILLHGNEDSGLGAIQHVLRERAGEDLPRPLMLMVGNVTAAREGLRRLEGQPDFNRIWPGANDVRGTSEAKLMAQIHRRVVDRGAFAAIDLHNNTGRNPHYGVVCTDEAEVLGLAAMFAPRAVRFRGLPGTQTASFSGLVPAVTAECGQPGSDENALAAGKFVDAVLDLTELPRGPQEGECLDLFHTLGVVQVKPKVALMPDGAERFLKLEPGLDRLNFKVTPEGTVFGKWDGPMPFEVLDEERRDVAEEYFRIDNGTLSLRRTVVPAMLTTDPRIIRQDCLGYLMEHVNS